MPRALNLRTVRVYASAAALAAIALAAGFACTPTSCPDCFVVVPTSDATPPTVALNISDQDLINVPQGSPPLTIIAVSDSVDVIASARDEDGGVRSVKIWVSFTYYRPGQVIGPGLVAAPAAESSSSSLVGESTAKSRVVTASIDLRGPLSSYSRVKADVYVEGENFHGGRVLSPVASLTYPTKQDTDTDYMGACRKRRVPVPPDWSETGGGGWSLQGNLRSGTNLLRPNQDAFVWTYSDPIRKGACIALPREGGQAGFICQSARTGSACFWDNKLRSDGPDADPIDWRGGTVLRIAELQDATELRENCTACHRGDNVFLMSPDDPTWEKVMRGTLVTTPGSTFSTRLEDSTDQRGGHPRYVPSARAGWENPVFPVGCAGVCHENPVLGFSGMPLMPPGCALTGTDPANCYR
jgi:hypothetical protein